MKTAAFVGVTSGLLATGEKRKHLYCAPTAEKVAEGLEKIYEDKTRISAAELEAQLQQQVKGLGYDPRKYITIERYQHLPHLMLH